MVTTYVSKLRRLLADGTEDAILRSQAPGYVLNVAPERIDARRFERLLQEGRRALADGASDQASSTLRKALALWRGPALSDLAYERFAARDIDRLEALRVEALEDRIEADLALGRHHELVPELETLVPAHPYRERLARQLMLALYRSGRQADALEVYRRARQRLTEELGIEPGPELQQLQQGILRQDAELQSAPVPAAGRVHGFRRRRLAVATVVLAAVLAAVAVFALRDSSPAAPRPVMLKGGSVGIIDPQRNAVVGEIPVSAQPGGVAVGAGSVWVGNRADNTLLRIDPEKRKIVRTIGLGVEPRDVAAGSSGVWVASEAASSVLRIDPAVNKVVARIKVRGEKHLCCPIAIDVADGAVWVSHYGILSRIDSASGGVVDMFPPRAAGAPFTDVAIAGGGVWLQPNPVLKLDPSSGKVVGKVDVGSVGLSADFISIAAGAGAVWMTNELSGRIWKIEPVTARLLDVITVGHRPSGAAVGEGAVWIAGDDGAVVRVDPEAGRVVKTISLGAYPVFLHHSIAAGAGAVWIALEQGS